MAAYSDMVQRLVNGDVSMGVRSVLEAGHVGFPGMVAEPGSIPGGGDDPRGRFAGMAATNWQDQMAAFSRSITPTNT